MSLRDILLKRLQRKFQEHLKRELHWDLFSSQDMANEVINQTKSDVDKYLDETDVKMANVEKILDDIINKILIPFVEKSIK